MLVSQLRYFVIITAFSYNTIPDPNTGFIKSAVSQQACTLQMCYIVRVQYIVYGVQSIVYRTTTRSISSMPVLACCNRGALPPNTDDVWQGTLLLPSAGARPGRLDGCSLITVRHFVLVCNCANFERLNSL